MFFAATRHFAFFDGFHKISGLNSVLKDEECFQRNQLCFLMKIGLVFGLCSIFARCLLGYCSISARLCSKSNKKSCSKNDLCSLGFARARRRSKLFPLELGSARKSFLVISLALGSAQKFRLGRSSSKNIRLYPTLHLMLYYMIKRSKYWSDYRFDYLSCGVILASTICSSHEEVMVTSNDICSSLQVMVISKTLQKIFFNSK